MGLNQDRAASEPAAPERRSALLLMGPTGAGKSDLALALAERFPFEIVSVDSAQVYRGMDIGTAKPDGATQALVRHHLIDIRDPEARYSAGDFVREASEAMRDIWRRGRQPLLVGGTMLYFHALSDGLAELPEADPRVRAQIDAEAAEAGWPALHAELARIDPAAAARIHANDPQRIQRALEVYRVTGFPITGLQQNRGRVLAGVEVMEFAIAPRERKVLHTRIEARFESMMQKGLVEEVERLRQRSALTAEHPSMRAVGYRQVWKFLAGQCGLNDARKQAVAATRQLAKRQLTWLRRRQTATWLDSLNPDTTSTMSHALSEGRFAGWSYV
jgi:tRNA dimethylallyltransferase